MSAKYRFILLLSVVGLMWPAQSIQAGNLTVHDALVAQASPGDLDTSFGGFGPAGYIPNAPLTIQKIALQPDGKLVAVGHRNNTFAVARFTADGLLDPSFSGDGLVTTTIHSTQVKSDADAVVIQPDGKIVVAGRFTNSTAAGNNSGYDIAIVRYTITGTLDRTWAGDGIVTSDFNDDYDAAHDLALDSFERIVVVGTTYVGEDTDMAVERFNPNGVLDPTFDGNGKKNVGFGWYEKGYAVAVQTDGAIVIAGSHVDSPTCPPIGCLLPPLENDNLCKGDEFDGIDDDFAVARLTSSGALDSTFNPASPLTGRSVFGLGGNDCVADLALQPDGKIVLAGERDGYGFALARLNNNGTLDNSFDDDGKLTTALTSGLVRGARSVVIQPDNKIVAAGIGGDGLTLVRYTTSGALDPSFGGDGKVTTANSGVGARGVVLQPDGRLVAAGGTYLVRYWPDGVLDGGGRQVVAPSTAVVAEAAYALAVQPDGKIVIAGFAAESTDQFALARFKPDGSLDPTFDDDGRLTFGFGGDERAQAVAIESDGDIVAAGYVSTVNDGDNFMIARFKSDGALSCFNITDFAGGDDRAYAVALQSDQKIVVAGLTWDASGGNYHMGLARYHANCASDASFGASGKTVPGSRPGNNTARSIIIQPDGKLVVAGTDNGDLALIRLTSSGSLDTSFGSGGHIIQDWGGNEAAYALARLLTGQLIVAGAADGDFLLARYNLNGSLDNAFGANGVSTMDFGSTDTAFALAVRADGTLAVAGCGVSALGLPIRFEVAQFKPDGTPDTEFSGDGKVVTAFGDSGNCARGVGFTPNSRIVAGGYAEANTDLNFALAQYVTTAPTLSARAYLPIIVK